MKYITATVLWGLAFFLPFSIGQSLIDRHYYEAAGVVISFWPGYLFIGFLWLSVRFGSEARFEKVLWLAVAIAVVLGILMVRYATPVVPYFILGFSGGTVLGHYLLKFTGYLFREYEMESP